MRAHLGAGAGAGAGDRRVKEDALLAGCLGLGGAGAGAGAWWWAWLPSFLLR